MTTTATTVVGICAPKSGRPTSPLCVSCVIQYDERRKSKNNKVLIITFVRSPLRFVSGEVVVAVVMAAVVAPVAMAVAAAATVVAWASGRVRVSFSFKGSLHSMSIAHCERPASGRAGGRTGKAGRPDGRSASQSVGWLDCLFYNRINLVQPAS